MPFDPQRLTPAASLNRVPFVAAPSLAIPTQMQGLATLDLLSAGALDALILEHRDALALTEEEAASSRLSFVLRARLASSTTSIAEAARSVLSTYGTRLGYLLAILVRGDTESREARPEWDETYWQHWSSIKRVYLGGGLAWPEVCAAASEVLRHAGADVDIDLAPFPSARPLIGAARLLPMPVERAVVMDFGQTWTKSALAIYENGELTRLERPEPIPASRLSGTDYIAWMAGVIATTLPPGVATTGICVSSYLDERQHPAVYASGGRFAPIQGRVENLRLWLSEEVSRRVGRSCDISLFHDATAAAIGLSPHQHAAVVMLGTALGVGFPREDDAGLTPLAESFTVTGV